MESAECVAPADEVVAPVPPSCALRDVGSLSQCHSLCQSPASCLGEVSLWH